MRRRELRIRITPVGWSMSGNSPGPQASGPGLSSSISAVVWVAQPLLAEECGARVDGVELTTTRHRDAVRLTELVGLDGQVRRPATGIF